MLFEPSSRGGVLQGEPFEYMPTGENADANGANGQNQWSPGAAAAKSKAERAEQEAYERGLREGEARVARAFQERAGAIQTSVDGALNNFRREREEYFNRIEPEVVQLALAIAKKILHREAQIDPLLLTGLVHVALEKVGAGARVRCRPSTGRMCPGNRGRQHPGELGHAIEGDRAGFF
jgi:flagellar biosynthesis/type III secretory pathway protein FliH